MIKKSDYLDYLGIQKSGSFRRKVTTFLDDKSSSKFPLNLVKFLINLGLYIPRKIVHNKRKNTFVEFYKEHDSDVKKLLELVDDQKSKDVINSQINFFSTYDSSYEQEFLRKNGLWEKHNSLLDPIEYFPEGVINLSDNEGFVDCGGYNGDTVERFVKMSNGKYNHIFVFEADKNNFNDLLTTVNRLGIPPEKINCYHKGVYSENGVLNFHNKSGEGSSLSTDGGDTVEVVAVDSLFDNPQKEKVTFVKMDIEGAELKALSGMQEIIKKNKPKLAICVYHKPQDFWEIPTYIKSLRPDYKIYFRQHALSRTGTVCYAV